MIGVLLIEDEPLDRPAGSSEQDRLTINVADLHECEAEALAGLEVHMVPECPTAEPHGTMKKDVQTTT